MAFSAQDCSWHEAGCYTLQGRRPTCHGPGDSTVQCAHNASVRTAPASWSMHPVTPQ
uniref:Uncharacterized protein n=1 Tax=Anguilla anguilla TaxID=7936 RepID=A0A0E9VCL3_ANGAN